MADLVEIYTIKRYDYGLQLVSPCFVPAIACQLDGLERASISMIGMDNAIISSLPDKTISSREMDLYPDHIEDFLAKTKDIFSSATIDQIRTRASQFDKLTGFPGLADTFIALNSVRHNVIEIITRLVDWADKMATDAGPAPPSSNTNPPPEPANTLPTIATTITANEEEVAGASHPSTMDITDENLPREQCPIIQIHLEGASIKEAWANNTTCHTIETLANRPPTSNTPAHMNFGQLPVYHGTDAFCRVPMAGALEALRTGRLRGSVTQNQVAPRVDCLPVLWTGFSPLRCFLWASYPAEVLTPIPNATAMGRLGRIWNCGQHEHTGITLFKFRPTLPAAFGQRFFVIPPGQEAQWNSICSQTRFVGAQGTPETWWSRFVGIHHNSPTTWPEAIHCQEFAEQRAMLASFIRQFWRTVWWGDGISSLTNTHEVTYAISFQLREAEGPKAVNKPEETDGKIRSLT